MSQQSAEHHTKAAEDPQRVVELLKSTAAAHPGVAKEPSPQVYVVNLSAGAVTLQ
jgi:small-conductance mechanosensitive channel